MPFFRGGKFHRTDIWREGKWLDLWSVVHFLSGVSLGLGISFFKFDTLSSVIIVFLLLVAYEMWEAMVKIEETPQNRTMDVVVGMVSFLPTFFFITPVLTKTDVIISFVLILMWNITLAAIGWYESRKATDLERKLRADIEKRRARFIAARERRKADRMKSQQQ
jgi:hypothetical protein